MTGPGDDACTWGISRFCSWFIQLWHPWLKREALTKHSLHYRVLCTQLCTNWTRDFEMTPSWGCNGVTSWVWICISFPLLLCTSTGSQEHFVRFILSVSKAIYCCFRRGLSCPSSQLFCLYLWYNNDSNVNCHYSFILKAADFLQLDTRFVS